MDLSKTVSLIYKASWCKNLPLSGGDIVSLHQCAFITGVYFRLSVLVNVAACSVAIVDCKDTILHHSCKRLLFLLKHPLSQNRILKKTNKKIPKSDEL